MEDALRKALSGVIEKQSGRNLLDAGRVESAGLMKDTATIVLAPPVAGNPDLDRLKPEIEQAVGKLDGINRVRVVMTAHREGGPAPKKPAPQARPAAAPAAKPAKRVIVSARIGGRAPLVLLPPLILHAGERHTPEAEAILRGRAVVEMGG